MNWFMNLWSVRGFAHDYFKEVCDKLNHHQRKYELDYTNFFGEI